MLKEKQQKTIENFETTFFNIYERIRISEGISMMGRSLGMFVILLLIFQFFPQQLVEGLLNFRRRG